MLGAGGVLGEAWISGTLSGIEAAAALDFRRCEAFLGTSAGSIVAARLAAGLHPRKPSRSARALIATADLKAEPAPLPRSVDAGQRSLAATAATLTARAAVVAGRPLLPTVLRAGAPAGALARSLLLRTMPDGVETHADLRARLRRLAVAFDGRLRIVAVDRGDGRRVVFGSPGSPGGPGGPEASVAEAVSASCAIPGVFAPVTIGGREYVDGGLWSLTNLDAAPAGRDTRVLCLNPMAGTDGAALAALRAFARSRAAVEEQALRARGAEVTVIAPSRLAAAAIGRDPMDPGRRDLVLAAGHLQGLELASVPRTADF